ncbi:MAG: T9SS type A sorting domain-containing protein [Candidatus Zixiibacteriota bacterium]|nr:MAG: T9SS type A sorting domain-containing protein [candidate division Zixibacteria bacterium]
MKKITIILIIVGVTTTSSATIINIPADWPTIQQGIDASADGDTVLVQPGTYVENINFNGHNIVLGSLLLTSGDTSYIQQTIINGDSAGSVIKFENEENNTAVVKGLTITNGFAMNGGGIYCNGSYPSILNNIIINNCALSSGGGIYIGNSPILPGDRHKIHYNIISQNTANLRGGGISLWNNFANILSFNQIMDNAASIGGGIYAQLSNYLEIDRDLLAYNRALVGAGMFCRLRYLDFRYSVCTGNKADLCGGGLYLAFENSTYILNSILWADTAANEPNEIINHYGNWLYAAYSDIDSGWTGYQNINTDPLFRDPAGRDFRLMATECGFDTSSPCIDRGRPEENDSLLSCSWGLGILRSDMGIYGGGANAVRVEEDSEFIPKSITLLQNYPNPFNAQTTIRFVLPESQNVQLTVYDLLGREVEILIDEYIQAGVHAVTIDAFDYPSGVYFARLNSAKNTESIKMLLLK